MALHHQGVEINHLNMVVESIQDMLAGYMRWKRSDCGEDGAFRHDDDNNRMAERAEGRRREDGRKYSILDIRFTYSE